MLNKKVSSLIITLALTVAAVFTSPSAHAQMIEEVQAAQNIPAVVSEHASRSGWEQPLVQKEHNLKHFYWTEIDRNKAAYKVINRTAAKYNTVTHAASNKPVVLPRLSNKNISTEIRGANSDVSGRLRPIELAQARIATPSVYSYNSYGRLSAPTSSSSSANKNCSARLMTY